MRYSLKEQIRDQMKQHVKQGAVFYINDFVFEDGEIRNKYAIILGRNPDYYYVIFTLTTSKVEKQKKRLSQEDYIFVPGGTLCFEEDTLILLTNIHKLGIDEFVALDVCHKLDLCEKTVQEIKRKIKNNAKISKFYKNIILGD